MLDMVAISMLKLVIMATIKLFNSILVALIDNEDLDKVKGYSWLVKYQKNDNPYAITIVDNKMIYMHSLIMPQYYGKKITVDHISRDTLDNRKCNLRYATMQQQMANSGKSDRFKTCSSQYKGVSWDKQSKCWKASIRHNGLLFNLGRFDIELNAAFAYNKAALKYFGNFANLNNLPETWEGKVG